MSERVIEIETVTKVPITPRLLAESFWRMSDSEQAEFFHELHEAVIATPVAHNRYLYGLGEMQWCAMARTIKNHSEQARDMFLAVSAFAYDYWPRKDQL